VSAGTTDPVHYSSWSNGFTVKTLENVLHLAKYQQVQYNIIHIVLNCIMNNATCNVTWHYRNKYNKT